MDYATLLKSKLAAIEKERTDVLTALRVLTKLELEEARSPKTQSDEGSALGSGKETAIGTVLKILQASDDLMSTKQVSGQLARYRTISKGTTHTCLTKLERKGLVYRSQHKDGRSRLWGLVASH